MKFTPKGKPRYAHQRRGLRKLIQTKGVAALLFDPGLGKTATVLDYCSILALKMGEPVRVLVIAPKVAVDTWVYQAEEYVHDDVQIWAEALSGTILERARALASRNRKYARALKVKRGYSKNAAYTDKSVAFYARSNYDGYARQRGPASLDPSKPALTLISVMAETFSSRRAHGSRTYADVVLDAVKAYEPHLVVFDESHLIKSNGSNISRLLGRMSEHAPRRILLTGTVMPHSPLDVFGQWRFLQPTAFGEIIQGKRRTATFDYFQRTYAIMGGYRGKQAVAFRNLDRMHEIMAENAVVARKEDSLDLPPVTETVVQVNLSPNEERAYSTMKAKKKKQVQFADGAATAQSQLTSLMRLRQITSGYIVDDAGNKRTLGTSKADTIKSLVNDTLAGEKRLVIFCNFTHEIEQLTAALSTKDQQVLKITGDTPDADRIAMRKRFGSDDPARLIIVAQISTLSMAVNELVTASHAIFGSMTQRRDHFIQARDRLNRIGQKLPVTFWYVVAPGTVDTVILDSHQKGTNLERAILNHVLQQEAREAQTVEVEPPEQDENSDPA